MTNIIIKTSALLLAIFALVSIFLTCSLIFDLFGIREREGNYVPFIVYANFGCAMLNLLSAYGMYKKLTLATVCLFISAGIILVAYIGLIFYIKAGGIFEPKIIGMMLFRMALTILFAGIAWYHITRVKLFAVPLGH
jgi:hypothetical protein